MNDSALNVQVGGSHYKDLPIQPVVYTERNKLTFLEGCIVKRITRYRLQGGKGVQDLEKIKHEVDLILELHYGQGQTAMQAIGSAEAARRAMEAAAQQKDAVFIGTNVHG